MHLLGNTEKNVVICLRILYVNRDIAKDNQDKM